MIDFAKLVMLVGPRFKRLRSERGDREHLARVKAARAKRTHPKRHATNQERSQQDRERAKQLAQEAQARNDEIAAFKREVAAYWRGERDNYPRRREAESL